MNKEKEKYHSRYMLHNHTRGILMGIALSGLVAFMYFNGIFGEPVAYTVTDLRLEKEKPSVFAQAIDTGIDFAHGHPVQDGTTPVPLSLYTAQTLVDITAAHIEQVCIVRALLDYDGVPDWLARIRLKDTSIFSAATGSLGFARWGDEPTTVRLGLFRAPDSTDSVNQLPGHQSNDIYLNFNEKDVADTSVLLLHLSPEKGVQPCLPDMDMTQYNRWKGQWNNNPSSPIILPDGYKY